MNDIKTIISDSPHFLINNNSLFLSARASLNSKVGALIQITPQI